MKAYNFLRENIEKKVSYLFFLVPIALISGPFFPDAFVSIIAIIFFSLGFIKKKILSLIKKNLTNDINYFGKYILYIGLFINLFPLLPSGNFFNNWLSVIFFSIVGLILYKEQKS